MTTNLVAKRLQRAAMVFGLLGFLPIISAAGSEAFVSQLTGISEQIVLVQKAPECLCSKQFSLLNQRNLEQLQRDSDRRWTDRIPLQLAQQTHLNSNWPFPETIVEAKAPPVVDQIDPTELLAQIPLHRR